MSTQPTDAELFALIKEHFGLDQRRDDTVINRSTGRFHDAQRYRDFAAAVLALAKFGQPAVVGEPVAYLTRNIDGDPAMLFFDRDEAGTYCEDGHEPEPLAYLHDDGYWTAAKNDAGRRLNDRLLFAGSPKVAVYTTPQPTQAVRPAGWEPEFDQFLSDVMTAAGLVTHGKQCKQLGERLGAAVMKLRVHGIKGGRHGTE